MKRFLLSAALLIGAISQADDIFPKDNWTDTPNPLASPNAIQGGQFSFFVGQEPDSHNTYFDNFSHVGMMFDLMYEGLLGAHPLTMEESPNLAKKWSISENKKTYTFWIDERAKWSDGTPITAHDVKATYDTVMASTRVGVYKLLLGRFSSPVVTGDYQISFTAETVHWGNLNSLGGFPIMPKHMIEGGKFDKIDYDFPVTSGPYKIKERKGGQYILFDRNPAWWGKNLPRNQHIYNFDELKFVFYGSRLNALDAFKKGQTDVHAVYTSSIWASQASGEAFDKNWIIKQRIHNYNPVGFQGWAMNMRRDHLKNKGVRKALYHLLNREKMNETLMYNAYNMHKSYFEDLWTPEKPCPNEYVKYDVETARKLLKEAGWQVNPETGKLEKDGKPFVINFLTRSGSAAKFLDIYREDLNKVGIELKIDSKDLAAWSKDMKTFNFDMTWSAWGAGVRKDPESQWFSKEADREDGNNITGFKNARVDELIERQRTNFNMQQRHDMVREIDSIIYNEYPYCLLWYINATRLLYWNKFGMPDWVLGKYSTEYSAIYYWWLDEDNQADLEDAKANGEALPKRPVDLKFDDIYKP